MEIELEHFEGLYLNRSTRKPYFAVGLCKLLKEVSPPHGESKLDCTLFRFLRNFPHIMCDIFLYLQHEPESILNICWASKAMCEFWCHNKYYKIPHKETWPLDVVVDTLYVSVKYV
eukprot:TRINITY_DN3352_c1_g1_i1.p1 TRINITY_DN3352_c1_g1~~TRINITY_DN3352_c1_g1_i1.p1  ORF type:complete len:116 (+),score=11.94 TRINITY_DN3352_c1_g1_i1:422-769(+)